MQNVNSLRINKLYFGTTNSYITEEDGNLVIYDNAGEKITYYQNNPIVGWVTTPTTKNYPYTGLTLQFTRPIYNTGTISIDAKCFVNNIEQPLNKPNININNGTINLSVD